MIWSLIAGSHCDLISYKSVSVCSFPGWKWRKCSIVLNFLVVKKLTNDMATSMLFIIVILLNFLRVAQLLGVECGRLSLTNRGELNVDWLLIQKRSIKCLYLSHASVVNESTWTWWKFPGYCRSLYKYVQVSEVNNQRVNYSNCCTRCFGVISSCCNCLWEKKKYVNM